MNNLIEELSKSQTLFTTLYRKLVDEHTITITLEEHGELIHTMCQNMAAFRFFLESEERNTKDIT